MPTRSFDVVMLGGRVGALYRLRQGLVHDRETAPPQTTLLGVTLLSPRGRQTAD
jgi:hypothetical protein